VFEDKELADQAVIAVEKVIHHEDMDHIKSSEGTAVSVEKVQALPKDLAV
jgi:hypothetical protein